MGHVQRLTVTCVDYRFIAQEVDHIKQDCGAADLFSFPGASLALVMPDSRQLFLDWIRKLHSLHGFREIELIDHLDCGAYKHVYADQLRTAATPDLERKLHEDNLHQAVKLLASDQELKQLKIYTRLLTYPENKIVDI